MPFDWLRARGAQFLWELSKGGYEARLKTSRQRLWELTQEPLFREAVFMSNPQVHGFLDSWRAGLDLSKRRRKDRKRERTLYRFLTRFTAKNDTTSFFGATSLGNLEQARNGSLELPVADVRRTFLEHWAAQVLLDAAADELNVEGPKGGIPVGHPRVFDFLCEWLSAQPNGSVRTAWQERLASLRTRFSSFEYAAYQERVTLFRQIEEDFRAWTQTNTRRGEGQYYSSKTVLHEVGDRSGEVVGLTESERLAMKGSLSPLMDFCALHILVERLKTRAHVEKTFGKERIAFSELADALASPGPSYHLNAPADARKLYSELKDIRSHMRARIDDQCKAGLAEPVELLDAEVKAFVERWTSALDETGRAYTNPDILLTSSAAPTLVLGDMHAMPFLTPAAFAAAPREEDVWEATRTFLAHLCQPDLPAFLTHQRASFVAYVPDLGEVALEIDGRSCVEDERRTRFDDLHVQLTDSGFVFHTFDASGKEMPVMPLTRAANVMSRYSKVLQTTARVYPIKLLELSKWLSGPGWRSLGELPRLTFGGVVVHRRSWDICSREWVARDSDPYRSFLKLAAVTNGELPRFCYVKGGDAPKPLLVDFADPISAELFLWMARNEANLSLTEMLPDADSLWLKGPAGDYTSELRTVYVR